jgi:hypothetical protein
VLLDAQKEEKRGRSEKKKSGKNGGRKVGRRVEKRVGSGWEGRVVVPSLSLSF